MEKTYNPEQIEAKYRSLWEDKNLFYYTVQKYGVVIYQNQLILTLCLTIQDYHRHSELSIF
jgi:hypothetical protein